MKTIKTLLSGVSKRIGRAANRAMGALRILRSAIRALTRCLRRPFAAFNGHWEALGYYAVLLVVLAALGTAAYAYRNRGVQTRNATAYPSADPGVAVQAQPDPTLAPKASEEPFIAPVQGEIASGYSADALVWSDTLSLWQTHPAVDLAASAGEAVMAAADGTVLEAFTDALFGNVIVIDHGEGRTLRYASLSTLQLVEIGQTVQKGDVISAAGTCAAEAELGPHVHLEYYVNQKPEDFSKVLRRENLQD